jgi:uncharacterized membrane protein
MSDLIIVNFRSAKAAFDAGAALAQWQGQSGAEPEDIVVLTRSPTGTVSVNQSVNRATGKTLGGGRWGIVIGMLCLDQPGTADGALRARFRVAGLEEGFLRDMDRVPPKTGAAVGMRVRNLGADRVAGFLKAQAGAGKLIRTRLSAHAEDSLFLVQAELPDGVIGYLNTRAVG